MTRELISRLAQLQQLRKRAAAAQHDLFSGAKRGDAVALGGALTRQERNMDENAADQKPLEAAHCLANCAPDPLQAVDTLRGHKRGEARVKDAALGVAAAEEGDFLCLREAKSIAHFSLLHALAT